MNVFAQTALGLNHEDAEEANLLEVTEQVEVSVLLEEEPILEKMEESVEGLSEATTALSDLHDQLADDLAAGNVLTVESARYIHQHVSYIVKGHKSLMPAISLVQEDYADVDKAKHFHTLTTEDLVRKKEGFLKGVYVALKNLLSKFIDFIVNLFTSRDKLGKQLDAVITGIKAMSDEDKKKSGIDIEAFLNAVGTAKKFLEATEETKKNITKLRAMVDGMDIAGFQEAEGGKKSGAFLKFFNWCAKKVVNGMVIGMGRMLLSVSFRSAATLVRVGKNVIDGKESPAADYHFGQMTTDKEKRDNTDFGKLAESHCGLLFATFTLFNVSVTGIEPIMKDAWSKETFAKINKLDREGQQAAFKKWEEDIDAKIKAVYDKDAVRKLFPNFMQKFSPK